MHIAQFILQTNSATINNGPCVIFKRFCSFSKSTILPQQTPSFSRSSIAAIVAWTANNTQKWLLWWLMSVLLTKCQAIHSKMAFWMQSCLIQFLKCPMLKLTPTRAHNHSRSQWNNATRYYINVDVDYTEETINASATVMTHCRVNWNSEKWNMLQLIGKIYDCASKY